MDEEIKLKITKSEFGLIYLAITEYLDRKAGYVIDTNDVKYKQMRSLWEKLNKVK